MMPPLCQLTYQPVFRSPITPVCTLSTGICASHISDPVQFVVDISASVQFVVDIPAHVSLPFRAMDVLHAIGST